MSGPQSAASAAPPAASAMPSAAYSIGPPPAAGVRRLHLNEFRFQHSEGVVKAARAQTETPVDALLTQYQSGVS